MGEVPPGAVAGAAVSGVPETAPNPVASLETRVSSLQQEAALGQPKGPETASPVNQPQEIAPEISGDPNFLKAYGEAYAKAKAQSKDGSVDEGEVKRQALEHYEKTKVELQEKAGTDEAVGERVKALEQKIDVLTSQNEQLSGGLQAAKEQLLQVASSLNAIMPAISELVQNAHANEKNPQKKEHWAQILLKLLAVAGLAIFTEGVKVTNPIGGDRG